MSMAFTIFVHYSFRESYQEPCSVHAGDHMQDIPSAALYLHVYIRIQDTAI